MKRSTRWPEDRPHVASAQAETSAHRPQVASRPPWSGERAPAAGDRASITRWLLQAASRSRGFS